MCIPNYFHTKPTVRSIIIYTSSRLKMQYFVANCTSFPKKASWDYLKKPSYVYPLLFNRYERAWNARIHEKTVLKLKQFLQIRHQIIPEILPAQGVFHSSFNKALFVSHIISPAFKDISQYFLLFPQMSRLARQPHATLLPTISTC